MQRTIDAAVLVDPFEIGRIRIVVPRRGLEIATRVIENRAAVCVPAPLGTSRTVAPSAQRPSIGGLTPTFVAAYSRPARQKS